jgi:hypothetical protein
MITMIFRKPNLLLLLSSLLLFSCSKSGEKIGMEKPILEDKLKAADSTYKLILPKTMEGAVSCLSYPEGCLSAHIFQLQKLDFIALEYDSHSNAERAAKRINGYVVENWVFDDVTGEPVLEKILKKIDAKKP